MRSQAANSSFQEGDYCHTVSLKAYSKLYVVSSGHSTDWIDKLTPAEVQKFDRDLKRLLHETDEQKVDQIRTAYVSDRITLRLKGDPTLDVDEAIHNLTAMFDREYAKQLHDTQNANRRRNVRQAVMRSIRSGSTNTSTTNL